MKHILFLLCLTTAFLSRAQNFQGRISPMLSSYALSSSVPTATAQLTNSSGFITSVPVNDSAYFYNSSGRVTRKVKVFSDVFTPNIANGYSCDISSAGFTQILSISVLGENNTASATSVPMVSLKNYTTSAVNVNIVVSNNATIASLVSPIVGLVYASSLTGYVVHLTVVGY